MHEAPRIYASFAEFARDLGLDSLPVSALATDLVVPAAPVTDLVVPARRVTHIPRVTPAALRAEGILEIGCVTGTSAMYVRTRVKLHVLHATWLPDRQLDDYTVAMAVIWIESHGLPNYEVAQKLEISQPALRSALAKAGYERLNASDAQREGLVHARASRKPGKRGRLVRVSGARRAQAGA